MKHVLMIDDVTINLRCVNEILKDTYRFSMAKSGKIALEMIEKDRPDLILLDISMPEMDGLEVLTHLGMKESTKNISVIILTGISDSEKEEKCLEAGAVDFIRKPFTPELLKERIVCALDNQED